MSLSRKKSRQQKLQARKELRRYVKQNAHAASPYATPAQLASRQRPADEPLSSGAWAEFRRMMNLNVTERGEWAGAPMPISNLPLVLEPRYPYQGLQGATIENMTDRQRAEKKIADDGFRIRNHWACPDRNCEVYVVERDGRIQSVILPLYGGEKLDLWINTMMAAQAWTIEAEERALAKLKGMIPQHLYEAYHLTGSFLETSKRTGMVYVFRRLRPTIAIRRGIKDRSPDLEGMMGLGRTVDCLSICAILCLHPIGYYARSWGGVMVPTDDVIAHLTLMRGDEALFWRKANKHPIWAAEAGL